MVEAKTSSTVQEAVKIRCYASLEEVSPLREALNAINLSSSRPDPFSTLEFYQHYFLYDEYYPGGRGFELWFLVAFRGANPVGYVALKRHAGRFLGLPASRVGFLVVHDTDRPHVVAREADLPDVAAACHQWLAAQGNAWSLLELHQQEEDSPLATLPAPLNDGRYRLADWDSHENATIHLRWSGLNDYYAEMSANMRSTLARQSRRLAELGTVEVLSSDDPASIPALFELYRVVESNSWKAVVGAGVNRNLLRETYIRKLVMAPAPLTTTIKILLLDGEPISGIITGRFFDKSYLLQLAYDERLAKVGPGSPMLALCVEESLRRGCSQFNLLNGFSVYKSRWLADVTQTRVLQMYRKGGVPDLRRRIGDLRRRWRNPVAPKISERANPSRIEALETLKTPSPNESLRRPLTAIEKHPIDAWIKAAGLGELQRISSAELLGSMPGKLFRHS